MSISEKALEYMQEFHERDPHYFQSKPNQRQARQGFIDLYQLDQKKGEDIWNHVFHKYLRKNKLKKEDFLKTRFRRPEVTDMNPIIKPKPQGIISEPSIVEIVKEETLSRPPQLTEYEVSSERIDHESVESAFEGFWTLVKLWLPVENLTRQEKESLGKMWLIPFRRFLSENWVNFGLPLVVTIGIFTKHIKDAKDKRKKENFEKKILAEINNKSIVQEA